MKDLATLKPTAFTIRWQPSYSDVSQLLPEDPHSDVVCNLFCKLSVLPFFSALPETSLPYAHHNVNVDPGVMRECIAAYQQIAQAIPR